MCGAPVYVCVAPGASVSLCGPSVQGVTIDQLQYIQAGFTTSSTHDEKPRGLRESREVTFEEEQGGDMCYPVYV